MSFLLKFFKSFSVILLFGSFVLLAACATTKHDGSDDLNANQNSDSVVTAGTTSQDSLAGDDQDVSSADLGYSTKIENQHYYFDFNQSDVHSEYNDSLKAQGEYLAKNSDKKIRLEGNTDDRGSKEYNIGLGYRRAQAVATVLKQYGVKDDQIKIVSYGAEKPVASGNDEEAWAKNRRVDLIYTSAINS